MSKSRDKNATATEGMFKLESPDKDWIPPAADIMIYFCDY